jgi:TolB-like protein/class 3 adenylate cyclase/Flp pilus assembly protein TadD
MSQSRRLAAILAADVAGYSRLIGMDEDGTLQAFKTIRIEQFEPTIAAHHGRLVKTTGDGFLVEFNSVVNALRCAVEVQASMTQRNADISPDRRIEFRMGINVGDIVVEDGDIFGDGVNVAARLEAIAEPGGICVSGRVQEDAAGKLDIAFEDMGEQALKNIARPVRVYRVRDGPAQSPPTSPTPPTLPLPDKPSIAVLPFQNMSGDLEQEYFIDGTVEDIITALSRIKWLFVIARNSSFMYKGRTVDIKEVGRELGVRYLLEGSVRKAGGRVRITAQLIEASSGAHLWADRFDAPLEDVFELQDRVAISVAGVIEPTLQATEIRRSAERQTNDLTAYDLCLRALSRIFTWEQIGVLQALELLRQAIERDPQYGRALALAARCHHDLHVNGWTEFPEASRRAGVDFARRALGAAGDDPEVLATAAYTLGYFGEDIYAAVAFADRALEINQSFARGWQHSGWLRLWAGQPDTAIEHFETALRLSPREHRSNPFMGIGVGHFFARRFEDARKMLVLSLQEKPNWVPTYRFLASCYAQMGRLEEAREAVSRVRELSNVIVPSATHWRNLEHRELYLSGLRLAAGEAT